MTIYFIRHGQTYANAEKKFAGVWDVSLNEIGIEQAAAVAERMKDIPVTAIYTSPLTRAHDTAKKIAQHHDVDVVVKDELMEMNFGIWEGKDFKTIQKEEPELMNSWFEDFDHFTVPEGESVLEMFARTTGVYKEIIKNLDLNSSDNIVIVAHGGVIQTLLSYLCYGDTSGYWRFGIDNCGINKVEYVMGFPVIKAINQ